MKSRNCTGVVLFGLLFSTACSTGEKGSESGQPQSADLGPEIIIGQGIGAIRVGTTFADFISTVGQPSSVMGFNHQVIAQFADHGVEVFFGSSLEGGLSEDAYVYGVGTLANWSYMGAIRPGIGRDEVVSVMGPAVDAFDDYAFYEQGVSVKFDSSGIVQRVAVYAPYVIRQTPPEMQPVGSSLNGGAQ